MTKEKRHFRRYNKESNLSLKCKSGVTRAKTVDYSLAGVGIIVDKACDFAKGHVLDLELQDPDIRSKCEVMWIRPDNGSVRVGMRNLGKLQGRIHDFRFTDTLIGLQRSGLTGVLNVWNEEMEKKVYIRDGDMIFAESNAEEDKICNIMLREKRITSADCDKVMRSIKESGTSDGAALVRFGFLPARQLPDEVVRQTEEIILSLFSMAGGNFLFEEMPIQSGQAIALRLSASNLIYRGIRRMKIIRDIADDLPPVKSVLSISPSPIALYQDIRLDDNGKTVFSLIDGRATVQDIINKVGIGSLETLKIIYALISVGMVYVLKDGNVSDEVLQGAAKEAMKERPVRESSSKVIEEIENMYKTFRSIGYYGVLGIGQSAKLSDIRSAYYRAAKKYHPDMHFYAGDDSLKSKLSDIFSYVYEAYDTLSDPDKKAGYDSSLSRGQSLVLSNDNKAQAKFEEGRAALNEGRIADAELLFGQAVYYDETIAEYQFYYGMALVRLDKTKAAERAFTRALKIDPRNPAYLSELGFVYMALGYDLRAKGFFERALKAAPGYGRALEGLGKVTGV